MLAANNLDPSIDPQSPDPTPRGEANLLAGTIRELSGDTLLYLLGAGVIALAGFALVPLYTRCLTVAGFGGFALIEIGLTVVGTITQLGFGTSYLKWYADLPESKHGSLIGTTLLFSIISGAIGGICFAAFAASPAGYLWIRETNRSFAWILAPLVLVETLQALQLADMRARRKPLQFCAIAVVRLVVLVTMGIWLVGFLKMGLTGVFLARLIGTTAGVLMLGGISFWGRSMTVDLGESKKLLSYGLPLVWSALMGVAFDATGRSFLSTSSGLEQVGMYGLALKISNVMQLFVLVPFGTAWSGLCFVIAHKPGAPRMYTRILGHSLVVFGAAAAILAIVTPVFLPIVAPGAYNPAARLVPWLLIPTILRVLEYWSCTGIYLTHRTNWMAIITTAGAVINVGLCRWLVAPHGAYGAAWAWTISIALVVIWTAWVSLRAYPMPIDWFALALTVGMWAFGFLVARQLPVRFSLHNLFIATVASLFILGTLLVYLRKPLREMIKPAH